MNQDQEYKFSQGSSHDFSHREDKGGGYTAKRPPRDEWEIFDVPKLNGSLILKTYIQLVYEV